MAYTDQKGMSTGRAWSLGIVIALHAGILWAMMNGGYEAAKKVASDLKVIDIEEAPPPPEEEPPPPPPEQEAPPPPVVTPPPIVQSRTVEQPVVRAVDTPPPVYIPTPAPPVIQAPPAPPAPPPPAPPPVQVSKMTPRGNPASWATNDDYPAAAQRAGDSGTTGFRLTVGTDGRVTGCTVTASSGSSILDDTTCRLVTRRARFNPGKDASGNAIGGTFNNRIRWVLPDS